MKGLLEVYKILLSTYGKRNWWPAQTAFEMMVGAILTQKYGLDKCGEGYC